MEENPQPVEWKRFMWLGWIAPAGIVLLIALCYGVVDLWDGHAWNEYRQNYEAHVAPLELRAYIPKAVPDDENFAATPFAQSWFARNNDSDLLGHDAYSQATQMIGNGGGGKFQDLVAWQEAFAAAASHAEKPKGGFRPAQRDLASRAQAAPDVLDGLKDDAAAFEDLRAASARADARYPVVYDLKNPWEIVLPHLARIKQTCLRLELRASAELAAGQNENAAADVKLMLYLADTLKTEPFLISYLVRIACLHIAIVPIWEGLADHRWTDAELQQLQARLEPYDFVADMQRSFQAERAGGVLTVALLKQKGPGLLANFEDNKRKSVHWDKPPLSWLARLAPSGWYDLEKLHYCQREDSEFQGGVDVAARRVFPSRLAANLQAVKRNPKGLWHNVIHHQLIASLMSSGLDRIAIKAAAAQTDADEAAMACALERYRLANRNFPDDLAALAPRFADHLPNDVITGEPYKYRNTEDGRFVLYSVGWNETDDGGVPGKPMFSETEGDWVW